MALEPEASVERPGSWPGSDIIALTGPSEALGVYQLAARWSERYATPGDDLPAMLERFRRAYIYLDAVTHGLEPPEE